MKKIQCWSTLAFLWLCLLGNAQNNGLLFEIQGNGLKAPSYLFGSLPLSGKYSYLMNQKVLESIDRCDRVVTEIDYVHSPSILLDSAGLYDYSFKILSKLFNESVYAPYVPNFKTNEDAEKVVFSMLGTGSTMASRLQSQYASKLGIKGDLDKMQWPNFKMMQYAIKQHKRYSGIEDFDSILLDYIKFIKAQESLAPQVGKALKEIPEKQQKQISDLLPTFFAEGKSDEVFTMLKGLKNGGDTIVLKLLNFRTQLISERLSGMMQKESVFAALNWLTLTNPKGILESLRKMGYTVHVVKMKKSPEKVYQTINQIPYQPVFNSKQSEDGIIEFIMPGNSPLMQVGPFVSTWTNFDLINKTTYSISRIKHNYTFKGKSLDYILKKIDSLLYESVPGTIERKEPIEGSGYLGYDILSVNRKENYHRLKLLVTPYEIVLVSCEGSKGYAKGPEATRYFDAFKLNMNLTTPGNSPFMFKTANYEMMLPSRPVGFGTPNFYHSTFESFDASKNMDIIVSKGSFNSSEDLDEDTFLLNNCLQLFTENLKLTEERRIYESNTVSCWYTGENNRNYYIKAFRFGIHYYLLAAASQENPEALASTYFRSFKANNEQLEPPFQLYRDTALHFEVTTPWKPSELPSSRLSSLIHQIPGIYQRNNTISENGKHTFSSYFSGEHITVDFSPYSKYAYFADSVSFWKDILDNASAGYEYVLSRKNYEVKPDYQSLSFLLKDTNTSNALKVKVVIKGRAFYVITTGVDTLIPESPFITTFYNTFQPVTDTLYAESLFQDYSQKYLSDLVSTDSATRAHALFNEPEYHFTMKQFPVLKTMLSQIPYSDDGSNREDIEYRIMNIMSSIRDSAVVDYLKQWYTMAGDTSELQIKILRALASQKTWYSFQTLSKLLIENTPAMRDSYTSGYLFSDLEDTMKLAARIAIDLIPLLDNEDFKNDVLYFYADLADSNCLNSEWYAVKQGDMLIRAKNELKRQNGIDNGEDNNSGSTTMLTEYVKILMPLYHKNEEARSFIDKSLLVKSPLQRRGIAIAMLKNNLQLHDSIWESLARDDRERTGLIRALQSSKQISKLPQAYRTQESYTRALACNEMVNLVGRESYKPEDLVFLEKRKIYFHQQWGYVYIYKIKMSTSAEYSENQKVEWKLLLCGFQPLDTTQAVLRSNLTTIGSEPYDDGKTLGEQIDEIVREAVSRQRHVKYLSPAAMLLREAQETEPPSPIPGVF